MQVLLVCKSERRGGMGRFKDMLKYSRMDNAITGFYYNASVSAKQPLRSALADTWQHKAVQTAFQEHQSNSELLLNAMLEAKHLRHD